MANGNTVTACGPPSDGASGCGGQEYTYDAATALQLVMARLNMLAATPGMQLYLAERIKAAAQELQRDGITLNGSAADTMLLVDLTVWEYSNRDKHTGRPEWLVWRIRDRWIGGP